MAIYAQRGDRRCPDCLSFPDVQDSKHWRACVPKRYWPQHVRDGVSGPTVVGHIVEPTGGIIASPLIVSPPLPTNWVVIEPRIEEDLVSIPSTWAEPTGTLGMASATVTNVCDCGYIAKSPQALSTHKRKAKQHQTEAVTARA